MEELESLRKQVSMLTLILKDKNDAIAALKESVNILKEHVKLLETTLDSCLPNGFKKEEK